MTADDAVGHARALIGEWARLLMGSLARAGVEDVVISPGSRSTPFVIAAQRCASLRCHSLLDERVAGFFALGRVRVTGRPCVLLCTSGTAGAHYFPALLEADAAGLALLVLTADRPLELADCGAPQTLDQVKLFGQHVRGFFELGLPDPTTDALYALRRMATQAVLRARWPQPGPVHLNARARKPLEPPSVEEGEQSAFERRLGERVDQLLGSEVHAAASRPEVAAEAVDDLADRCRRAKRVLLVAGPLAPHRAARLTAPFRRLSAVAGFSAAPDVASGLRFGGEASSTVHLSSLLRCGALTEENRPDLVLQVGEAPIASAWPGLFAGADPPELFVLTENRWSDPTSRARGLLFGDLESTLDGLAIRLEAEDRPSGWLSALDRELDDVVDRAVGLAPEGPGPAWSEAVVARCVVERLPREALLALGNSLPIRLVEQYGGRRQAALRIASQRGVNGIDGLVAGFAGSVTALEDGARAASAALLLLGDVSLAHDLGGLRALREVKRTPTVVLVIDNGGGRIFEQLPLQDRLGSESMSAWTTPPEVGLADTARALGLDHEEVHGRAELERALETATDPAGGSGRPLLLVARVPPHDAAALHHRLGESLRAWSTRPSGSP